MKRFFACFLFIFLLLSTACSASTLPPHIATQGNGTFTAVIRNKTICGRFSYNGFTFSASPNNTAGPAVEWYYDGQQYCLTTCNFSVTTAPSTFPPHSVWKLLPQLFALQPLENLPLTRTQNGWQAALQTTAGLLIVTADQNGNIVQLDFPSSYGCIYLQYTSNSGSFEPLG